jgi:hypothetical protein
MREIKDECPSFPPLPRTAGPSLATHLLADACIDRHTALSLLTRSRSLQSQLSDTWSPALASRPLRLTFDQHSPVSYQL